MINRVPDDSTPHGKLIDTGNVRDVPTELMTAIKGVDDGNVIDEPLDEGDGKGIGPELGND